MSIWRNHWYQACGASEVEEGAPAFVTAAERAVAIARAGDRLVALARRCPECDAALAAAPAGLRCAPCDRLFQATAPGPLPTFPVMIVDDEVYVYAEPDASPS